MNPRLSVLAINLVAICLAPVQIRAQAPRSSSPSASAAKTASDAKAGKWTPPRLPDGKPDLGGFWTSTSLTGLQRPPGVTKEFYTDDEIQALEGRPKRDTDAEWAKKKAAGAPAETPADYREGSAGADYNQIFLENDRKVSPNKRTSIITDPPDGKIPSFTPEAQKVFDAAKEYHRLHYHNAPEDMTTIERCITWVTSGPPMLPTFYNNNYQIVQTHDHLSILAEMVHDVRIIPLDGSPHDNIRQWMGDPRGHWEGDTLVVETTSFNGKRGYFGAGGFNGDDLKRPDQNMRVVERFTRTAPDILTYQFTVTDPDIYTKPFSGEIAMRAFPGPVYEYACHEGNHAMELVLAGARADEKKAAEAAAKKGK
jgi:hypothetical protein